MRLRTTCSLLFLCLGACTTFSAARPADVSLGPSYHWKVGVAAPSEPAVSWFSSYSDCVLCDASNVGQFEFGASYGRRTASGRKYALGVFLDGLAPQLDVYTQLREGPEVNHGIGARAGYAAWGFWTAKTYFLHDRRVGERSRLLLSPGLYYFGNFGDPDGEHGQSPGWMAGLTQTVGLEFEAGSVTFTPQLTLIGIRGELGGDAAALGANQRRIRFGDIFAAAALGISFFRR